MGTYFRGKTKTTFAKMRFWIACLVSCCIAVASAAPLEEAQAKGAFWDKIKDWGQSHLGSILGALGKRELADLQLKGMTEAQAKGAFWDKIKEFGQNHLGSLLGMLGKRQEDPQAKGAFWDKIKDWGMSNLGSILGALGKRELADLQLKGMTEAQAKGAIWDKIKEFGQNHL